MRKSGFAKSDDHARELWGEGTYVEIPKSVFATVAWHLANAASGRADAQGAAEETFGMELKTLHAAGIIGERQATVAMRALGFSLDAPDGDL